tara:strand:- start:547 stop:1800 length:1254 start_codon:yes stop_codon:yes gene_type:complete
MLPRIIFNNKNQLLINSTFLYLSHGVDYLVALLFLPYVSRTIGTAEFGKIGLAQTFGIFLILFMEFGSSLMVTRKISRIKDKNSLLKSFLGRVIAFKILLIPLACLSSLLAIALVPIFKTNPEFILLVLIGSIFQAITPIWYFQGVEKIGKIVFPKIFFRLLSFVLVLIFVKSPLDGWIVLSLFSLSSILISIYLISLMIKEVGFFKIASPSESVSIFKNSFHSFIVTIAPIVYQNISIIILSITVSPVSLGLYYGSSRIYRAFNTVLTPISFAFYPMISSVEKEKIKLKKLLIKKYLILIFFIGIFISIINLFFSENIILVLLGKDYLGASKLLKIFCFVLPLTAISNALGRQWLMSIDKDRLYAITQIISSAIAFICFLLLLVDIGIYAFPISLVVYEIITISLILIYINLYASN